MEKDDFPDVLWDVKWKEAETVLPVPVQCVPGWTPALIEPCSKCQSLPGGGRWKGERSLFIFPCSLYCSYLLGKSEVLVEYWLLGEMASNNNS